MAESHVSDPMENTFTTVTISFRDVGTCDWVTLNFRLIVCLRYLIGYNMRVSLSFIAEYGRITELNPLSDTHENTTHANHHHDLRTVVPS